MFGRSNGSLGPPAKRRRLSIATPPAPSSSATSLEQHSFNADAGPSRKPTLTEIELDMQETRIPSSASPSPMKMPRTRDGSRGSVGPGGTSPAKVSNEVTKALQESITSLLGKRASVDDDLQVNAAPLHGKPGKRARPQSKSKVGNLLSTL